MARLTQIDDASADAETAAIFGVIRSKIGMVPNLYRVAANQPAALRALLGANDEISKGGFDARTREAIALTVAGRNGCDYCASAHGMIAKSLKVEEGSISDYLSGRASDPRLDAILRLAAVVLETRGKVSDEALEKARLAGLSEADVVETVGNVVVNIFTNYLNHVADTDVDFPHRSASMV